MRLGRDDAPDGVKSVLSGLPWPLAAVMPVALWSCFVPGQEGWPKPSAHFDPAWPGQISATFETGNVRTGSGRAVRQSFGERQQMRRSYRPRFGSECPLPHMSRTRVPGRSASALRVTDPGKARPGISGTRKTACTPAPRPKASQAAGDADRLFRPGGRTILRSAMPISRSLTPIRRSPHWTRRLRPIRTRSFSPLAADGPSG